MITGRTFVVIAALLTIFASPAAAQSLTIHNPGGRLGDLSKFASVVFMDSGFASYARAPE